MVRQPAETQTLYAEVAERLSAQDLSRSFSNLSGSFATKTVKDAAYWYFKTSEGPSGQREYYVGPDDDATRRLVDEYRAGRVDIQAEQDRVARLCAMLRSGGAMQTEPTSAKVISALAAAGMFRLGGVLVGTQAFIILGNVLGVRWQSTLRTQDIDVAALRILKIAVPQADIDFPKSLDALKMGFLPVPGLDSREPWTSFTARGHSLRVELLTPAAGSNRQSPVRIERLNAAAQPLEMLGYILENPVAAVAVNGGGTLVNVPDPARFALHKLIVSGRRPVHQQTKASKDRQQAAELIEALYEDRRGDLILAVDALNLRPASWRARAKAALEKLPEGLAEATAFVGSRIDSG